MSHKDMMLAKRGLWQSNKSHAPIVMSASLEIKKDALMNLVKQHYKNLRRTEHQIDSSMETIMLKVIKEEAERLNIDMTDLKNMDKITGLIDVNLINKIEAYKDINAKLSKQVDVGKLAKMKSS